jgi:hypothetical protein
MLVFSGIFVPENTILCGDLAHLYNGPRHNSQTDLKGTNMSSKAQLVVRQKAPLATPSDIDSKAVKDISGALNALLADVFSLYLKTKNSRGRGGGGRRGLDRQAAAWVVFGGDDILSPAR